MSVRLCFQRLTIWMCPQQRAFKGILRTYSGSTLPSSELFKSVNKHLLPPNTIGRHHTLNQRIPLVLDTKYMAYNSISYSTDSKRTSTGSGKEDEQNASKNRGEAEPKHRDAEKEPLPEWPDGINPHTGEKGGPKGPEPTRYGDWERKGRVSDF